MVGGARGSFRQAWASFQQLCKTQGTLHKNGFPQPTIGHSVGLQSIVESSANMQQKHAPSFLVHRCSPVQVSLSQAPTGRLREQLQLQSMNLNGEAPLPRPERFDPLHFQLSMENAPRLARLVRLEALKTRLHAIQQDRISYEELLCICMDSTCASSEKEARRVARSLDESGHILILGRAVYLHPHQVARAIENLMPLPMAAQDEPPREELERMEKQKNEIDVEAKRLVRRELWCGLWFMTIQTAVLLRLTFWDISWDVMEPICFFLTTAYFLAGYAFFLGTSRDPTFQGFFHARLEARKNRLTKKHNFDLGRFMELQRICNGRRKRQKKIGNDGEYE